MGETDPHRRGIAGVMDVAEIDDAAAIPGTEFVDGRVESSLFVIIAGGHGVGDADGGFEKFWGVVPSVTKFSEHDAD